MRLFAVLLVALTACASATSGDGEPICPIAGTYTLVSTVEASTCPDGERSSTVTISPAEDGFVAEMQGVQGGCPLRQVGQCKLEGKCDLQVAGAQGDGTLQIAWTFDARGLSGVSSVALPVVPDVLPQGCTETTSNTGTRR
jgi:hypothetical protein